MFSFTVIDARFPLASWYLWILGGSFLVVFALPLFAMPLTWARWFRWRLPSETALTVYLGRCLGGVALAIVYVVLRAAPTAADQRLLFEFLIAAGGAMTVVHIWGAIARTQPWTETAEIVLYGGLTGLALYIFSALPTG